MAHFALLWKARTIEKYRQNYENEKYLSIQETNTPMPQKSLSQRLRCYRQDTQKRFSKVFQKVYPEGSSLSHFFLYLRTDQTCLNFVLKSLLGFFIGLALTYLCFLFLVFQLSISLFHATIVSSIIGVLLTLGLAFSYRIRCLIFLLLPQFFSRAGRYTITCYALVLILTGPATNTLKNSEVLTESMACRQEQIKSLVYEVKQTSSKPLNSMRESIKIMVDKIRLFAKQLKENLLKVNRLTLSVLETIHSTFLWLRWLSEICNETIGTPYERCIEVLKEEAKEEVKEYKQTYKPNIEQFNHLAAKVKEICSNVKKYKAICIFTDFVNGSFVASIKRRLKEFSQRIKHMLYLQIHVHHSYSFSSNTSDSASQVAAGIVTEIRKRADPLLTWLSWSSCVTSLFLLLIIFRAKYYQHMFETRSRFDNKYITKELRDLDLNRLRHGRETILPLNRRERTKYVSTTSFRLVASEKIHLNRSIVFMTITTFKLLIHMVADYSLYWVLMTIQYNGKNQTPMPYGVPNAGMHITGTGAIADMFRSLLMALTSPLDIPDPLPSACLPNPNPPNFQRYTQIGILIFLLWFFSLFEPYGLRLRHVVMGLYRPERAKARAEWLYDHILRLRGGFMKFARRKLHRTYKYHSEEKYTFKKWLNKYIPCCLRFILRIPKEEVKCLLCGTKEVLEDPNTKLQKCETIDCPGVYCGDCFSDIGELCTICLSPSDYDDLSDVSFEKGSSDESEDDYDEGKLFPKYKTDESDNETFDCEDDNILLPKPLRDKIKYENTPENSDADIKPNDITDINKQTYYMKTDLLIIKKVKPFSANNNLKEILQNIAFEHKLRETKKTSGDKKTHNNNRKREDNDKKVAKDVTDRNVDNKENKTDGTDEVDPRTSKNFNNKNNRNDKKLSQDKIIKHETASVCYFNRLNTMMYACWPSKKINLFNACKPGSQNSEASGNENLDYDKNFKTRKKVEKINRRTEDENARQYRIFTYLAEQDWVVKKTITNTSTEKECSLNGERPNNETVECLKKDIFRPNMYLLDTVHKAPLETPFIEQHVFICDHCRFHCYCSGNEKNQLQPLPICENERDSELGVTAATKANVSKKTTLTSDDPNPKKGFMSRVIRCFRSSCCVRKKSTIEDTQIEKKDQATCTPPFKICCNKKRRRRILPQHRATQYEPFDDLKMIQRRTSYEELLYEDIKTKKDNTDIVKQKELIVKPKELIVKPKELIVKPKELIVNQKELDCKHKMEKHRELSTREQNVEPERKKVSSKKCCNKKKGKGQVIEDKVGEKEKQKECPKKIKTDERKRKKNCSKCKGDAEKCKQQTLHERCDSLCPETCTCGGRGIEIVKCDPLCPDECTCNRKGVEFEQCDPLCPEDCTCGRQGIAIEKCDPLCPENCTCGGHGVAEEHNYLCSGDCCCKDVGTQPEQVKCKEKSSDKSINDCKKHCASCGRKTKICPKCNKKISVDKKSSYHSTTGIEASSESSEKRYLKKCSKSPSFLEISDNSISNSSESNVSMKIEKPPLRRQCEKCNNTKRTGSTCKRETKQKPWKKRKKQKEIDKILDEIIRYPPYDYDCVLGRLSEGTLTPDELFCSCAIQCPPLNQHNITEKCCGRKNNEHDSDSSLKCSCCGNDKKSDYTGTDNTIRHVYIERPRIRPARRTIASHRHKCVGTDITVRYNVGTITNEKGLLWKNIIFVPENHGGYLWDRILKQDRGVSTRKTVSFRSRVQLIPSSVCFDDFLDLYTPSRYLLESQRYYNELYTGPSVYPVNESQKPACRRTSSYGGSRSFSSRRGRRAKRLEGSYSSYLQQKYLSGKRVNPMFYGAKYSKSQKKF